LAQADAWLVSFRFPAMLAMPCASRNVRARKERLPTIREDECQDLEKDATQVQLTLCRTFGDLEGNVTAEIADDVIKFLKAMPREAFAAALQFLGPKMRHLALSETGSRIVRCAIDKATSADRHVLLAAFRNSVVELSRSTSGHEILVQLIDCIPVFSLNFMICETISCCAELALHKNGSDVIESMLLHFHPTQLSDFSMKLVEAAPRLTRSPSGSRVLQTLVEYGGPSCRELLLRQLLPQAGHLAMNPSGSHLIRKLLEQGDETGQLVAGALLEAVRSKAVQVVNIACSRCGSAVLQQMSSIEAPEVAELQTRLNEAVPFLEKSRYGRRLLPA